jgi:hypothetical protein
MAGKYAGKYAPCPSPSMNPMREDRSKASSPMYAVPKLMTVRVKYKGSKKGK